MNQPVSPDQDRLTTKRMEKMKLQTDLKQLQSYRSSLESFKANLESKAPELNNELENAGKYGNNELHVAISFSHFWESDHVYIWIWCHDEQTCASIHY